MGAGFVLIAELFAPLAVNLMILGFCLAIGLIKLTWRVTCFFLYHFFNTLAVVMDRVGVVVFGPKSSRPKS